MKRTFAAIALLCLLTLPTSATAQQRYELLKADYGSGNNWVDVTERVRSLVQNNSLRLTVSSSILGAEARRGRNRVLRMDLRDNRGRTRQVSYRENQQVNLRISSNQNALQITRATYAGGSRSMDVTSRLNSSISNNQLNLQVTNQTMGGDPSPGIAKTLTVDYTAKGRNGQSVIQEGSTLRLDGGAVASNNSSLRIDRATYGSQYRSSDVTARLNSQVQNNQLNLQVNNASMGGDPSPGQAKSLNVQYSVNGRSEQIVVNEGDVLRLPRYNSSYSTLQITRGTYGSAYRSSDVTARLNSQIQSDQLNLRVNNETMGGDPSPNQSKTLTVQYSVSGLSNQVVVNEGDMLRLPYEATNRGFSQNIRCESLPSNNYGRQYCSANTRGGVRLLRQINNTECVQGSSWGYDNNGVWVDKGCRAEFELMSSNQASSTTASTSIPNGTELSIRTNELIDSKATNVGQTFSAVVASDVTDNTGAVIVPRGSDARLVIRSADGGSITSASELVLDIGSLTVYGTRYLVSTNDLSQEGGQGIGANKKTGIMVGGGAALGTLIGAIVGGGKGAAIGAAVGAGAGAGTQILTRGKQVQVPAETLLNFKLDQEVRLQASR